MSALELCRACDEGIGWAVEWTDLCGRYNLVSNLDDAADA